MAGSRLTGIKNRLLVEGNLSRGPFGVRFLISSTLTQYLIIDQYLDGENGLMIWTFGGDQFVTRSRAAYALNQFLQTGLWIVNGTSPTKNFGQIGFQAAQNKIAGSVVTLVQVNGGNNRLEGFFQDGLAVMAAGLDLSLAKGQMLADGQSSRSPGQAGTANQRRTPLGQFPFGYMGEVGVEFR